MAAILISKLHRTMIKDALEMKLASLKRAQKGSTGAFVELYEREISAYNSLVSEVLTWKES